MMTSCIMAKATIVFLLTLTLNSVTSKPVSLLLLRKDDESYLLHVNFYNDTFQQFYSWMTQSFDAKCFLNFKPDLQHPYSADDIYVDSITVLPGTISSSHSDYFSCSHNPEHNQVTCQRTTNSTCHGCISVRLCGLSPDTQCARILPSVLGEKLLYNSTRDNIQECSKPCTQTTTSTNNNTDRSVIVLSSVPTNDVNSTKPIETYGDEQTDNNNLPVIVGPVCGAILLASLITIGTVLRRRRRLSARQPGEAQGHVVSSVDKNGNERCDYINTQSVNTLSNLSETPELKRSLNSIENGNRHTSNSDDGYYQIKHYSNEYRSSKTKDKHNLRVINVISRKKQKKLDDDYDCNDATDNSNIATVVAMEVTNSNNYSIGETIEATSQQKSAYSRLGETATDKINPYNLLPAQKEDYSTDYDDCVSEASIARGHESFNGDVTSTETVYSLAKNVDDQDVSGTRSQDFYTRLGEKVQIKINPYTDLLKPKDDPKSRKPLADPDIKTKNHNQVTLHQKRTVKDLPEYVVVNKMSHSTTGT